jgi:hypothetical protein
MFPELFCRKAFTHTSSSSFQSDALNSKLTYSNCNFYALALLLANFALYVYVSLQIKFADPNKFVKLSPKVLFRSEIEGRAILIWKHK